ncbi:GATA zinc finger domain-containing protein 14-like isoform X1 [Maniola jurtina]|uniref:GATA zinc finger domain-containing protein 14-like isoform X1 n=1 Tax=Maniola jurtina TaxID=191418 RepID=UPI001E688B1A|nr:GATA zinc finger domain-containing protein 14-like isoform X1 [Maniola jurtina]
MWRFVVLTCFAIPWITAQNPRNQRPFDNGHGWDIRLAVPGEPGNDYPTLDAIPRTSFTCSGKDPGYYADVETNCQVFRVCTLGSTYSFQSFICPNGTLFNQAVLVCDWWMKVNCKKSRELFETKKEKFVNLKLGTQFMTDIKKMISHPMRNPYDETYAKHNLIVMQEYKPPSNQFYNGASLNNFNRNPYSAYFQTNQAQRNNYQNSVQYSTADISTAASTPSTQYYTFSQNQKQSKPYQIPNRTGNLNNVNSAFTLNSHSGKSSQANSLDVIKYSQNSQSVRPTEVYQRSIQRTQPNKPQEKVKENIGSTYVTSNQKFNNSRLSKSKQIELGIEFSKQQLNRKINQEKFNSDKNTRARFLNVGQTGNDTKQNSVSSDSPPGIITKTLAFRRIIKDSMNGNPKSRITFKTWIVRPSRNSKLIVEPTPYTYNRPANFLGKIIADITGNNRNASFQRQVATKTTDDSYVYNVPTVQISDQILTTSKDTPDIEFVPSTTSQTFTGYPLPTPSPTKPALLYLVPTTFKPSSRLYVPPPGNDIQISRQYLSPILENSKLVAAASSPRPFLAVNDNKASFFLNKRPNADNNNLAFSDILTKDKLGTTVDGIVKDTNNVLETASPVQFQHFNQNVQSVDYPIDNYLYSGSDTQSDEKLTLEQPPPLQKSSRLIAAPSIDLEPPIESIENVNQNTNKISNLPYFEESTRRPNTIERTVSLKITIPENIADLLFRNRSTSDSENLEILSTGNSNSWLLSNKVSKDTGGSVIPIGKLIWNKNSNISDSQDLVFSLLIDSINAAKDYNNIVQQSIATTQPTPTQPQFQNVNNEELQRISNDISQLTSSQFSAKNYSSNYRLANLRAPSPSDSTTSNTYGNTKNINSISQNQREQHRIPQQQHTPQQKQNELPPFQVSGNNELTDLNINSDKLYSGQLYQLPVPVVSKQIYNSLFPANYKLSNNDIQAKSSVENSANSNTINNNIINKSKADYEFIQSHTVDQNNFQSNYNSPKTTDQGSSANDFMNTLELPKNGITAQLQDNIVGTIPHPLDDDKLIKYKKDQTYYIYTHLNNDDELSTDTQINDIQNIIANNLASGTFSQNDKLSRLSAYELIPSLGYKLEDEREKQKTVNTFQINDYNEPKQRSSNENANLIRQQDIIATDVDFTVDHSKTANIEKPRFLYDGPNSYSAPQKSVGNLIPNQNSVQSVSNFNSKIEKFDTDEDKNYGYPKISPAKRFLF